MDMAHGRRVCGRYARPAHTRRSTESSLSSFGWPPGAGPLLGPRRSSRVLDEGGDGGLGAGVFRAPPMKPEHDSQETVPLCPGDELQDGPTLRSSSQGRAPRLLYLTSGFSAALLLAAIILSISNSVMMARIEHLADGVLNKTDRRFGFGAPLPKNGFSGETYYNATIVASILSASRASSTTSSRPTASSAALGNMATFPDSIDLVDERTPDKPYRLTQDTVDRHINVVLNPHVRRFHSRQLPNSTGPPLRQVSAVIQYTIEEDGRSNCQMAGYFPPTDDPAGKPLDISGPPVITVWNLTNHLDVEHRTWNPAHPLRTNLTWATRPPRGNLLGTLYASPGTHPKTTVFPCPSGGKMTVELTCPSPGCEIALQQIKTYPMQGQV